MEKDLRYIIVPAGVAGAYAAMVLFFFVIAMFGQDEFGYRFVPVVFATYPLSFMLQEHTRLLLIPSILIGGAANTAILFVLCWFIASLKESNQAK